MRSLFRYEKTISEYQGTNLEPLNPYKPKGAHDSFTVKIIDSGLGLSVDGVVSKIIFYGFDKMEIKQIEYVYHENDNVKRLTH